MNEITSVGSFVNENTFFIEKKQILCVGNECENVTYYILLLRSGYWNITQGFLTGKILKVKLRKAQTRTRLSMESDSYTYLQYEITKDFLDL